MSDNSSETKLDIAAKSTVPLALASIMLDIRSRQAHREDLICRHIPVEMNDFGRSMGKVVRIIGTMRRQMCFMKL